MNRWTAYLLLLVVIIGCTCSPPPPSTPDVPTFTTPALYNPTPSSMPMSAGNGPPFRVVYTCDRQLCLAKGSGEVRYLTDLLTSSTVTDFVIDPQQRWVVYARQGDGSFREELWRVSLHTGEEQPLHSFDAPYAVSGLAWSPPAGGDRLACVVTPVEAGPPERLAGLDRDELWLIAPDGSQRERIIPQNADEAIGWRWLYWSQDGRVLFANRFAADGMPVLYALDLSTGRLQRIAETMRVLDQNRQGALLLGSTVEDTGQLWTLDWPTATVPVSLTPQGWRDTDARWSADGTQIILASTQQEYSHGHLWLMRRDGGQRRQLTSGADSEYLPRWLLYGGNQYVLFLRPRHALWLLALETGETRLVVAEANVDYVLLQE